MSEAMPSQEQCGNCGAIEGTDAYDNFHDSQNCWAGYTVRADLPECFRLES